MSKRISIYQSKSGAPWTPASLSDLRQWYKADGGLTKDGSNLVSQWEDMSGNGLHLDQSNYYYKPLWIDNQIDGKPVIRFDNTINGGYNKHLNFTANAANPFTNNTTTFYVYKKNQGDRIFAGFSYTNQFYHFIDYSALSFYLRDSDFISWGNNGGIWTVLPAFVTIRGTLSGFRLYVNGNEKESEKALLMNTVFPFFGGDPVYFGSYSDCLEVIVYDRKLSDAEIELVNAYIRSRYPSIP